MKNEKYKNEKYNPLGARSFYDRYNRWVLYSDYRTTTQRSGINYI